MRHDSCLVPNHAQSKTTRWLLAFVWHYSCSSRGCGTELSNFVLRAMGGGVIEEAICLILDVQWVCKRSENQSKVSLHRRLCFNNAGPSASSTFGSCTFFCMETNSRSWHNQNQPPAQHINPCAMIHALSQIMHRARLQLLLCWSKTLHIKHAQPTNSSVHVGGVVGRPSAWRTFVAYYPTRLQQDQEKMHRNPSFLFRWIQKHSWFTNPKAMQRSLEHLRTLAKQEKRFGRFRPTLRVSNCKSVAVYEFGQDPKPIVFVSGNSKTFSLLTAPKRRNFHSNAPSLSSHQKRFLEACEQVAGSQNPKTLEVLAI